MRTTPFAVDEPSETMPPSGVQRNAFASRFVITWSTRSPSVTIVGASGSSSSWKSISRRRASSPKLAWACSTSTPMSTSCGVHGEPVRVELRQIEHVADEPLEPDRLAGDDVERRTLELGVVEQPVADRVDVTLDRGQRRPQLVRDGHQELPLALLGRREPRRHLVEALGEVADLVAATAGRHADGVVARRDLVGRARQGQHRPGDLAREPPREQPGEQGADGDGGGEPQHEREPLVAELGARLRHDDRAERVALGLEPHRLRRREVRAAAAGRRELEGDRPFERA